MHEQQQSQSSLTPEEQAILNSRQASSNGSGKGRQRKTSSRITPVDRHEIEKRTNEATSEFRSLLKGELTDVQTAVNALKTKTDEAIDTGVTAAANIVQEIPALFSERLTEQTREVLSQRKSKSLDLTGLDGDMGFELSGFSEAAS